MDEASDEEVSGIQNSDWHQKFASPSATGPSCRKYTRGKNLFRDNIKIFFFAAAELVFGGGLATRERYVPWKFSYKRELLPGGGQYCPPDKVLLPREKIIKRSNHHHVRFSVFLLGMAYLLGIRHRHRPGKV